MLTLQRAHLKSEAVTVPASGARDVLTTIFGYLLGLLLAMAYIGPALGLLALTLYLLA